MTLLVGPTAEARAVGERKRELKERHHIRQRFWTALLAEANKRSKLFAGRSPGVDHWLNAGAGRSGLEYSFTVRQHDAAVELYIDRGPDTDEENLAILRSLLAQRGLIEGAFGGPLDWQELPGRRACRIKGVVSAYGYRDEEQWPEIIDAMVGAMGRLERALKPHIADIG